MEHPERHRETLRRAIEKLPAHDPPDLVWWSIEQSLAEGGLRSAIRDLPRYHPPDAVWEGIADGLDGPARPPETKVAARVSPLWISVAATVALALVSLWWVRPRFDAGDPKVTVSYASEPAGSALAYQASAEADQAFQRVFAAVEQRPFVHEDPGTRRLKAEFEELSAARDDLLAALDRYGQDQDLILQLGAIERDRSRIIKQLAAAL